MYIDEMNTALKKKQVEEAIRRIKLLNLHSNVKNEFEEKGKLNYSENAILLWCDKTIMEYVKVFEERTDCIVYHVIKNHFEFGTCYSFLYVSSHEEDWIVDVADNENGKIIE